MLILLLLITLLVAGASAGVYPCPGETADTFLAETEHLSTDPFVIWPAGVATLNLGEEIRLPDGSFINNIHGYVVTTLDSLYVEFRYENESVPGVCVESPDSGVWLSESEFPPPTPGRPLSVALWFHNMSYREEIKVTARNTQFSLLYMKCWNF